MQGTNDVYVKCSVYGVGPHQVYCKLFARQRFQWTRFRGGDSKVQSELEISF